MSKIIISFSILLGAVLLLVGCGKSKADTITEAVVCHGILFTYWTTDDIVHRIKKSMSGTDKDLVRPAYDLNGKLAPAIRKLIEEKAVTEEAVDRARSSGEEIANKISTYSEMKKRIDECEKTMVELAKVTGTN